MYKACVSFTEDHDNFYVYSAGDVYPREGYEPDEERITFLLSNKTSFGRRGLGPVISKSEEPDVQEDLPDGQKKPGQPDGASDSDENPRAAELAAVAGKLGIHKPPDKMKIEEFEAVAKELDIDLTEAKNNQERAEALTAWVEAYVEE